jgi:hypothetical protein
MRLPRLIAFSAALLSVLFASAIGLIRAQPYDDSQLTAILEPPPDCPPPCFLGIRPGQTDVYDALGILRNHDWVEAVDVTYYNRTAGAGVILWTWAEPRPDWTRTLADANLQVFRESVVAINLETVIPFGYIPLRYGETATGGASLQPPSPARGLSVDYWVNYQEAYFQAQAYIPCPVRSRVYLHQPARLTLTRALGEFASVGPGDVAAICQERHR